MNKYAILLVAFISASLCVAGTVSAADRIAFSGDRYGDSTRAPSGEAMAADVLLLRPLGIVATVLGSAAFVVSLPFSALGGNVGQAADKLVAEPAAYTFKRPLGEL